MKYPYKNFKKRQLKGVLYAQRIEYVLNKRFRLDSLKFSVDLLKEFAKNFLN
jgi:hypothetical protein